MPFWLASKRTAQATSFIQRFDPRFWTVDFPRPMLAAATVPAPDMLRVDAVFHRANDLAGIIWESADRWDHPLLGYDTDRDYAHTVLAFRWRSAGVLALDGTNSSGPRSPTRYPRPALTRPPVARPGRPRIEPSSEPMLSRPPP